MKTQEEWLPVVGHEGKYEVSSLGRVRSLDRIISQKSANGNLHNRNMRGKVLSLIRTDGYLHVSLGIRNPIMVHVLVAAAFIGPRPKGHDVRHLDGSRDNNIPSNLAYGTRSQNNFDRAIHSRYKLTKDDVAFIRDNKLLRKVDLAEMFGVNRSQIHRILIRKSWHYVD
jgi:hypothetical protein